MVIDYKTAGKTATELSEDIMEMVDKLKKEVVADLENALDSYFCGGVRRANVSYHIDRAADFLYAIGSTLNAYDREAIEEEAIEEGGNA